MVQMRETLPETELSKAIHEGINWDAVDKAIERYWTSKAAE
jgi:hypothetical protein